MRYFKYDLWLKDSEEEWNNNSKEYNEYFESIKNDLPYDFMEAYEQTYGFHDFLILKVSFENKETVKLHLCCKDKHFCIEYQGVSGFKVLSGTDFISKEMQISEYLEWGYDEFYKQDNEFIHSVLTSSGLEFEISFRTVSVNYMMNSVEKNKRGTVISVC